MKIRIVKASNPIFWYANKIGEVFEVEREGVFTAGGPGGISVKPRGDAVDAGDFEIVNEEADGMGVIEKMQAEIAELKTKVGALEFVLAEGSRFKKKEPAKSPQQIRDEIVANAKAEIEALKVTHHPTLLRYYSVGFMGMYECNAEFITNFEKRTVVCLLRKRQFDGKGLIVAKGIAKADSADCFNVHIGKAIALRRALGLEVPAEYYNAPAPTEVRVGDVVDLVSSTMRHPYTRTIAKVSAEIVWYTNGHFDSLSHVNKNGKIIDDSRE